MHLFELGRRNWLATAAGICMMVLHRSVVRHGWQRRMMAHVVVSVRRSDEVSSYGRRRLHRRGRRSCAVRHAGVEVETSSSVGTVLLLKWRWLGWHVRIGGRMMRLDMRRRWGRDRC